MSSRILFGSAIVFVFGAVVFVAAEAPPTSKPSNGLRLVDSPVHYTRGILILSTKAGTAAVRFSAYHDDGGLDYDYRYQPKKGGAEHTGKGSISPTKPKPADRATTKTGWSGETTDDIVAGDIAVLWGKGGGDWGWVHYIPEDVTVQVVALDFDHLELARFQR
jgi:hypothetical protein